MHLLLRGSDVPSSLNCDHRVAFGHLEDLEWAISRTYGTHKLE